VLTHFLISLILTATAAVVKLDSFPFLGVAFNQAISYSAIITAVVWVTLLVLLYLFPFIFGSFL
jgi:hypothetical protein